MKKFTVNIHELTGFEQKLILADNGENKLIAIVKHLPTESKVEYKLIYYVDDGKNNMVKRTNVFTTLRSAVYGFNNTDNLEEDNQNEIRKIQNKW